LEILQNRSLEAKSIFNDYGGPVSSPRSDYILQRVDSRRVPSDPTIVVVSLATGVEKSTVSPNE